MAAKSASIVIDSSLSLLFAGGWTRRSLGGVRYAGQARTNELDPDAPTLAAGGPSLPQGGGMGAALLFRGLLRRVAEDGLGLQELVEGVVAPLAPVAAHLVAAERGGHVAAAAVDRDLAGAQPRGDLAGLFDVGRLHIGGEAVLGVVADIDGLVDRFVAEDRQHRAEDLFTGDGHVVGDVGEDGGLHIVALVEAIRTDRKSVV